ncbi:MAG: ACP phosphodiesterase [Burkholderiales bacterium]
MADHVRGADLSSLAPGVALGIRLHRRVDALTDSNPGMAELKSLVEPGLRRYAGILYDVFLDHVLLSQWSARQGEPLADFTAAVYASLARAAPVMPEPARSATEHFVRFGALTSCATTAGVAATLARIARRLKHPVDLAAGVATLERHGEHLQAELPSVFAAVREEALDYLGSSLRMRPSGLSVSR